ncbi:Glutathione peroxidase 7 [Perkinsus chesapeaki]|uniref:Glutathione peroxidase 7 n=1 Tax=Perkinsus chesapeaki TaxID=330153 RepID=A0A7J6M0D6_PERCH|nr:Glutathione peroxidase 7 [Perkinsus chesapeaki]
MTQGLKVQTKIDQFVTRVMAPYKGVKGEVFLLASPVNVNGEDAHPVFEYLKFHCGLYNHKTGKLKPIPFNFGKFLINQDGKVVRFWSLKSPDMAADVEACLDGTLKITEIVQKSDAGCEEDKISNEAEAMQYVNRKINGTAAIVCFAWSCSAQCKLAVAELNMITDSLEVINVDTFASVSEIENALTTFTGQNSFPQIFLRGNFIENIERLKEMRTAGELDAILGSGLKSAVPENDDEEASRSPISNMDNPPASRLVTVAKLLGMDPVAEPQCLWIAKEACKAKIDHKEWKEFTGQDGSTMYYNLITKKVQKVHPFLLEQIMKDTDDGREKYTFILKALHERIALELPVSTPQICEQIPQLLGVDPTKEFFLVRCLKQTLEAYVAKQYDLTTFLSDMEAHIGFLRRFRKNQVKDDIIKKPEAVVMCEECEDKSAVLKCEVCQDYYCQDCFNATHATGNRRGHVTADVEQLVCGACDEVIATCQCVQCGSFFCDNCYVTTHASRPELHNHLKRVISGLVCQECEHLNATVLCEDCVDLFCTQCFIKLHGKGRRRQHVHLSIDNTGQVFRGGFLVPPEEAQVLIDRSRSTAEGGPWVMFRDDNHNPFWYHFGKRVVSLENPFTSEPSMEMLESERPGELTHGPVGTPPGQVSGSVDEHSG